MTILVLKRPLAPAVVALSLLITAGIRAAPEPTPSEISVARRLFEEGKKAETARRFAEAAHKFRSATAIKDTPGLRFHLAVCEEEQGAFVEALVEYDRARELIDSGIRAADVERVLPAARERVRAKLAQLTLQLPADVRDVEVQLNGKTLSAAVLGVAIPTNPGKHHLRVTAPGRIPFATEFDMASGQAMQLPIELPAAPAVAAPGGSTAAASNSGRAPTHVAAAAVKTDDAISTRTVVLVGEAALAAAGLGTGIGFSVARGNADARVGAADRNVAAVAADNPNSACAGETPVAGCDELTRALNDRRRHARAAAVGFVTAGASAIALGLTYWLWPQAGPGMRVAVAVSPERLDLALSGRF